MRIVLNTLTGKYCATLSNVHRQYIGELRSPLQTVNVRVNTKTPQNGSQDVSAVYVFLLYTGDFLD